MLTGRRFIRCKRQGQGSSPWSLLLLAAFVALLSPAPTFAADTNIALATRQLAQAMTSYLSQPRFDSAIWGIKVVSLDTGQTLFENHADRLMSPASNSKLYTGALGLDRLGGGHRISTPVYAVGTVGRSGDLRGDLVVVGRGDPSWHARRAGTNFWDLFEPFVQVLKRSGVRCVHGDLIADATWFRGKPTGSSWTIDDLRDAEVGHVCALTLNDNLTTIRIAAGRVPGVACELTTLHPGTGLIFSNHTVTVASNQVGRLETFQPAGSGVVSVLGQWPVGAEPRLLDVVVPLPADWFAAALKAALKRRGITVAGRAYGVVWPQSAQWSRSSALKLGEVLSPPVADLVRDFMKPSQNLETDLLLADVGETARADRSLPGPTSEEAGLVELRAFLSSMRAPVADLHFDEGSGLSRNNLTTANLTVALLQSMSRHRESAAFLDSLPVAGVDGSLRFRFRDTAAAGNLRAKTGTLRWSHALSGYLASACGERLAFCIMLNRYFSGTSRSGHDEIDPLVLMLADFRGRSDQSP